jgi:hypothetical protein
LLLEAKGENHATRCIACQRSVGYEAWHDKVHDGQNLAPMSYEERARDWASLTLTVSDASQQGSSTGAQLKPQCRLRTLFQLDGSPATCARWRGSLTVTATRCHRASGLLIATCCVLTVSATCHGQRYGALTVLLPGAGLGQRMRAGKVGLGISQCRVGTGAMTDDKRALLQPASTVSRRRWQHAVLSGLGRQCTATHLCRVWAPACVRACSSPSQGGQGRASAPGREGVP